MLSGHCTQEPFAFLNKRQKPLSHIMHTYTCREKREEEMREGALSVQAKINAHYRNIKCTKEEKKKHIASTLDI